MVDELNQIDGINGVDDLNNLSDDVLSHTDDIIPIDPIGTIDPGSSNESTGPDIDIETSNIKPEVMNGLSFKGGACVCSCDMSCTVGY